MRKKLIALLALALTISLGACSSNEKTSKPTESTEPSQEAVIENFSAEYEMFGTTSAGLPKNDTFIFEGTTTDGIITTLNFDIIRNKGLEGEYSKKSLMGYMMNVSDAKITATDTGLECSIGMNGYTDELGQYMITATTSDLTTETTFKDLTVANYDGTVFSVDEAIAIYQALADEGSFTLTADTLVSDLVAIHGLFKEGEFTEGSARVAFTGINGGRSYGEQIDAIVDYILANKMTLEEVYEMFKTENQQSTPIMDRDTISGATIAFVGDFQRTVYLAIHGELFEGVVAHTTNEGKTKVEVVTQGFGGEIETHVTFDDETKKIVTISVRDAMESEDVGALLTKEDSTFIQALVEGQDDLSAVDTVTGATVTSKALIKAVECAIEYYNGL